MNKTGGYLQMDEIDQGDIPVSSFAIRLEKNRSSNDSSQFDKITNVLKKETQTGPTSFSKTLNKKKTMTQADDPIRQSSRGSNSYSTSVMKVK